MFLYIMILGKVVKLIMAKNYLSLLVIGVLWGSQFLFQQMAVASLPPVWVGAGRSIVAFLGLLVICRVAGVKSEKTPWKQYHLIGFLEATVPFVLVAWGQQFLDTAVAAILMGTIPFFTVMLAPLVIKGARITFAGLGSVLLGFAGLVMLFYPELMSGHSETNMLAAVAVIFAAACFAVALLLLKRFGGDEHPLVVARNVLGCASLQILVVALVSSPITELSLSLTSLGAVVYLGIMCGAVVYFLYMMLIRNAGPVFASMNNYLVPLIGVLLGATFNGEALLTTTWVALAIILAAVAFNQVFSDKSKANSCNSSC